MTQREKNVYLLVHPSSDVNSRGLGGAEVRSQELHPGLPVDGRDPCPWGTLCCFSRRISRELDWKRSSWSLNQCSYMGCWLFSANNFILINAFNFLLNAFSLLILKALAPSFYSPLPVAEGVECLWVYFKKQCLNQFSFLVIFLLSVSKLLVSSLLFSQYP